MDDPESFLRAEDVVERPALELSEFYDDPDYTPDFGLESLSSSRHRIDADRIIVKPTGTEKPYSNKELKDIASDLFGVDKTVVEKTTYVAFLTTEKSLARIERDNQLRSLNRRNK
jgi:hypothetical protein